MNTRTVLGLAASAALALSVAACANDTATANPPAQAATHSPSPAPAATIGSTGGSNAAQVGDSFTVTYTNNNGAQVSYDITCNRVIQHAAPDNSFDTAPAGQHLAAAEFTIRGDSGTDSDDANNDAAAIGSDAQTYTTGMEGLAAGTNFNEGLFRVAPGVTTRGWVSFDVKNGVAVAAIQWTPGAGFGDSAATWVVAG